MNEVRSILMIDDDEDDRILFQEVLKSIDSSVQCWMSKDGQDAMNLLTYELVVAPDLIFLDLNMPRLNGLEFLKLIKPHSSFGKIPIVMYTTSSNPNDMKRTAELGACDYIIKPPDFNGLHQTLKNVIDRHLPISCSQLNQTNKIHTTT